jgi:hypothetical protein
VQDQGLAEPHRDIDVGFEVGDLIVQRRVVALRIDSGFADRDNLGLDGPCEQLGALARLIDCVVGMDASSCALSRSPSRRVTSQRSTTG